MKNYMRSTIAVTCVLASAIASASDWEGNCQGCNPRVTGDALTVQTAIDVANHMSAVAGDLVDIYKNTTAPSGTTVVTTRHYLIKRTPALNASDLTDLGYDADALDDNQVPKPYGSYHDSGFLREPWGKVVIGAIQTP